MYFSWGKSGSMLAALLGTAMCATPQAYTISARPGAINYIDGTALLNGRSVFTSTHSTPFLKAGDTLSTMEGKTEVLLTPGIFLRVGANSAIRVKSMALTDIDLELQRGEAMIEADNILPDNAVRLVSQGASIQLLKPGLYRFTAGPNASATAITGKAEVVLGDKKVELGNGHEVLLEAGLPKAKFDKKQPDDLYAWSNVRSQYEAAASLQSARSMPVGSSNSALAVNTMPMGYGPYGMSGWAWNGIFNSWAWVPGGDLAFFNPFGYGFFAPGVVQYAPVYFVRPAGGGGGGVPVPVNPNNPPAFGKVTNSVASNQAARSAAMRSYMATGFTTPGGHMVAAGNAAGSTPTAGSSHWNGAAIRSAGGPGVSHAGGYAGSGGHAGGFSGVSAASSAGHASAGAGGAHR